MTAEILPFETGNIKTGRVSREPSVLATLAIAFDPCGPEYLST